MARTKEEVVAIMDKLGADEKERTR